MQRLIGHLSVWLLAILSIHNAWGGDFCQQLQAFDYTKNIESLKISADAPSGALLLSYSFPIPAKPYALCGVRQRSYEFVGVQTNSPVREGVYATGAHGVGYSVFEKGVQLRPNRRWAIQNYDAGVTSKLFSYHHELRIELVKTGKIIDGSTFLACAHLWSDSYQNSSQYCLGGTVRITHPTCSAAVGPITLSLSNVSITQLAAVGSVSESSAPQSIRLQCKSKPRVVMQIGGDGVNDDPLLFALNRTPDTASGVAVQLLRNGIPIKRNETYTITTAAETQLEIPLTARYFRYGSIRSGSANARMVASFSYQ